MASSTPLNDIEENFFRCSVCSYQFKEPKQLPCLHRYCKVCLKSIIQSSQDGSIKCPTCKEDYVIPANGVDDFKTDFHMKSVIVFIELQKSLEKKELKICIDCSKKTEVTAYCFKCKSLLCDPCYQRHLNNPMLNDHKAHILNVKNIEAKNLTLEKLAALTEDPRCHMHIKQPAQLCCSTCRNVPVCVTCVYGKHKGHDLHDVTEIAQRERESLQSILDEFNLHKTQLYELPGKVKSTKRKLKDNLSKQKKTLTFHYEQQVNEIKANLKVNNAEQGRDETNIKYRRSHEENELVSNRETEINIIRKKYDDIMTQVKRKYDMEYTNVNKKHDGIEKELGLKLKSLESNLKSITTAHELLANQNENELQELLYHREQIIKRYENFTATTLSILATKDEWTDAQCIPDIRSASKPLIEEIKKEFPELDSLYDLDISVKIVHVIKAKDWWIDDISSSRNGSIVITGTDKLHNYTHITVVNVDGEIQRQDTMKGQNLFSCRYCCFLSEFKVATVSKHGEIGMYDVRDGSYKMRNISDVISRWPKDRWLRCVTTNYISNYIIVGSNSRYLYVFDDQLNYRHTITLPDVIRYLHDIIEYGGRLLVCDNGGKRAYTVSIQGSESKLMYEFSKPDLNGDDWAPINVCTDKNGFIFILWIACISLHRRCVMVQYSQDGRQLLRTRQIDKDAICLTTLEADETETILISTKISGKLYTYGI